MYVYFFVNYFIILIRVLEICHSLEILIIHVVLSLFFVIPDQINQGLNENLNFLEGLCK